MGEIDIRAERLKKLEKLEKAGMEAYPADSHCDISIADTLATFDELESNGKKIHIGGRIMSKRGQGGIIFVDLFDGSRRMQVVLQKTEIDEALYNLFTECADTGDFIEVSGTAFKTKRGERSIQVLKWRMLAKSILPIPDEWFGLKDEEKRLREREIDLLLTSDLREMFVRKARFWSACRSFLEGRDFLEIETPILETSPGGAEARPFVTHHNALDIDVYLRISAGELWQKRLLVAGFPKDFEIG